MQKLMCPRCKEKNIILPDSLYSVLINEELDDFFCGDCEVSELEAHRITEICNAGKVISELTDRELNNFMHEFYKAYGITKLIDIAYASKTTLENINE